jgi:hypothetical protein
MAPVTQRPLDVSNVLAELDAHPLLWNQHTLRTQKYGGTAKPHHAVDDIWVRYNAWAHYDPKHPKEFFKEHDSVWYPAFEQIPGLRPLIFGLMAHVEGERLGGVLITRIPAGSSVAPHKDGGWHAGYYRKFGVQLRGGPDQFFCFEGETMVAEAGDVYEFDNTATHWVENRSNCERITMIVCIRAGV